MQAFFMTDKSYIQISKILIEFLHDCRCEEVNIKKTSESIYIGCKYFSIDIVLEEELSLEPITDGYNVNINRELEISILNAQYDKAVKILAQLFIKLMEEDGDFLVLDSCSEKIIWRTDKLYVASGYKYFPFSELNLEFNE